ncbi:MAG: hypothetical protein KKH41_08590 [Candidatus Thermoplasmatota archaeon]|nr:hypothetical protein [Euryarchaeota archaeon]MBU4031198.1 hypothetical protein [Candidatus Thermoplasmatota archaeon]MBU4070604.1 hypothetical protein [Candidatus Thermoplasmatota archaeon]MBU4143431.1 hypothetical protein [Candidatus Thermoplasmatota archaeon]MBU4592621.1 hypothetical protein [Candidatus Thermoplasmatota archaeon]
MMAILAYLVRKQEEHGKRPTANEITKKAPEFIQHAQRTPRINIILKKLEKMDYIRSEKFDMGTVWEVTDRGRDYYRTVAGLLRPVLYS